MSYAVKWREPNGQTFVGRLALGPRALRLEGRRRGSKEPAVNRRIGYDELHGLRVGRSDLERLDGRPALVVERPDGPLLVTDAGMGAPIVQELVERLADLRLAAPRKATVVVPLKEGVVQRVRELVAAGPPFPPDQTSLTRHEVLLTPREAIFVFEAETDESLRALLGELDIWSAAPAWSQLVAGAPRLAGVVYAWKRLESSPAGTRRPFRVEQSGGTT